MLPNQHSAPITVRDTVHWRSFIVRTLWRVCLTALVGAAFDVSLSAHQNPDLVTPPANVLLSNYNTVPVGPNAGLESGAYVARVGDPSAAWINPAGLSRGQSAELSGSSGVYQLSTVSPKALPNPGGSIQDIPSLVGFTVPKLFGGKWTLGVAVLTSNSWTQSTDSQVISDRGSTRDRFGYSADSQFAQLASAASLGFASGRWRLGGGLALIETEISRNEVVSDRVATDANLASVLIDSRGSGSAIQVRPLIGVQYDLSPHLFVGAALRGHGVTLLKSGSYTAEAQADDGTASQGVSFFDSSAAFDYRFPFELHGGVAYVVPRVELEFDVHGFTGVGTYALLSSTEPIITYASPGAGASPVIGQQPFNGFSSQSRGVANVSTGGHVALTSNGAWSVHFGAETDLSPAGPNDQVFTHVNMYGGTLGVSGTKAGFSFSVGVNYRSGSSDNVILRHLSTADATATTIRVRTIGLIYSLSYKF
jgi:hypothetical protein